MTDLFTPGAGVLFMKVGTHAREELGDIIARKQREIDEAGFSMWGYGGNTCHPVTMVQPFAREYAVRNQPIVLSMQPMTSKHFAEPVRADEYSVDGLTWETIPEAINVLGSRYALCIKDLTEADEELPIGRTRVAIGRSRGKRGTDYIRGRVDKACLEVTEESEDGEDVHIGLVAELVKPWAVFLRNS